MVIAEIGTSHGGSLEKAKELIDAALYAEADAVKFQWVIADEILHPKTGFVDLPTGRIPLYERFRQLECPADFYAQTLEYARSKNLKWICSPFGLKSLELLLELKPDAVKIASPELNHFPMLKALKKARETNAAIPVIVSSGVSKQGDIEAALAILGTRGVSLLHCITSYPAPEEEYNVRLIAAFKKQFGVECGLSDHSLDPVLVPCLAASQGATVFEKHITLSKKTSGLDDPVALEPEQFLQMTKALKQCQAAINRYGPERGEKEIIDQMSEQYGSGRVQKVLGNGIKALAPAEEKNYGRTNRSLHYMKAFEAGHILRAEDVGVLRTEKILSPGIGPEHYESVLGKKLTRAVEDGAGILSEDLEGEF
ncbi:MAG: N-acetylneuraminate synthase family protein [Treponema sp.]|nr:N-acetylneuraminate synthase family protein [Treponema sp.]